jgi:hypothetical protein
MFTNIDPVTGQTPTFQRQLVGGVNIDKPVNGAYSNQMTDFDNEYVWHCHILGHEENDFMRPMIFHPNVVLPDAPGAVGVASSVVTWTDPTPVGGYDVNGVPTAGATAQNKTANPIIANGVSYPVDAIYPVEPTNNPKNEIGFKVFRTVTKTVTTTAANAASTQVATPTTTVALVEANATQWMDPVPPVLTNSTSMDASGVTISTVDTVVYDVVAYNAAGDSKSGTSIVQVAPLAATSLTPVTPATVNTNPVPTNVTQTYTPASATSTASTTLTWDSVTNATGYTVSGATCTPLTATSCTITGLTGPAVSVAAMFGTSTGAAANVSVFSGIAAPVALNATAASTGAVTLTWANSPFNGGNSVTGLTLSWVATGSTAPLRSLQLPATNTGATVIGLAANTGYTFSVVANGSQSSSTPTTASATSGQ